MTPRKRFRLLISVLGGSVGAIGLTMIFLAAQVIEGALGPEGEAVQTEVIDRTGCPQFHGWDDKGKAVILDKCR